MEQYRVTRENMSDNLAWFDDRRKAIDYCKKHNDAKCVLAYIGTESLPVYVK